MTGPSTHFEIWAGFDRSVRPVTSFRGGTSEALRLLDESVQRKFRQYPENHGKPKIACTSRLSLYLHFGHVGPHTIVHAVQDQKLRRPPGTTTSTSF